MNHRRFRLRAVLAFSFFGNLSSQAAMHDAARPPPLPAISEPVWVFPSDKLPKQVVPMASNNNVGITLHDDSGFGSHLVWAAADDYAKWNFPARSDPERYDSPKMFRQGAHLYLIARRDIGGPFDRGWDSLPLSMRRVWYWAAYSFRAKRTALYWIDRERGKDVHLSDFPSSSGDTAFPSVIRLDGHRLLVANYTGGDDDPNQTWFSSQISDRGSKIYLVMLSFPPAKEEWHATSERVTGHGHEPSTEGTD